MEKNSFNLEGAYNQLKEEDPFPWTAKCLKCGRKLITEAKVSFDPSRDNRINIFRPANCPECIDNLEKLEVKIFASINKDGEVHPKNIKGEIR